MPSRKDVVEAYIEGFRRSDHARILSCLTDDVVWVLHGYKTLQGKEAFDAGYACVAVIQRAARWVSDPPRRRRIRAQVPESPNRG